MQQTEPMIHVSESARPHVQLIRDYYAAWSRQDPDTVLSFFRESSVFDERAFEARFAGLEEIRGFIDLTYAGIPDFKVVPQRMMGDGDNLAAEWLMSGTLTGDLPGLPRTGRTFEVMAVSTIRMQDQAIAHICDYWNPIEARRCMGLV